MQGKGARKACTAKAVAGGTNFPLSSFHIIRFVKNLMLLYAVTNPVAKGAQKRLGPETHAADQGCALEGCHPCGLIASCPDA